MYIISIFVQYLSAVILNDVRTVNINCMDAKFSQRIKDVLSYSKEEAIRLGNTDIGPEHLFLGIFREGEGIAIDVLVTLGANLYELRKDVEGSLKSVRSH